MELKLNIHCFPEMNGSLAFQRYFSDFLKINFQIFYQHLIIY